MFSNKIKMISDVCENLGRSQFFIMNAFIKVVSLKFPNTESVGVRIIIISNLPSDAGEGP